MDPMKVDVHNAKASHMSTPLTYDFQWHLNKQDYPDVKCKVGKDYMITVPMECTSIDGESYRFVVKGKLDIHDVKKSLMDTFTKDRKGK